MAFNHARYLQHLRNAEINPSPLPDVIVSYTDDLITEPTPDQSLDNQNLLYGVPTQLYSVSAGDTAAQTEFDQVVSYIDEAIVERVPPPHGEFVDTEPGLDIDKRKL
ncbi:hypothetical protein BG015_006930 [Linnemannia schmuckeri]|uniref:Uncharacterized protein n=1 Tax=Linnemannia schmuckeri TaxID=64567 RepID=A0A9P5RZ70_9FUNG|nr:hypothetical protein BG015_006930 [Linnemannia schmuckeri]